MAHGSRGNIGSSILIRIGLAVAAMVVVGAAYAAPGGSNRGQGSKDGGAEPPDLGDLVVLYRDAAGIPILTADFCRQPLAAPGVTVTNTLDGTLACTPSSPTESCTIPVDPATCAVVPGYETYTQEVDFGRTSVVRSPVSVLESQMDDVVVNLSTADCTSLDPAGRLVTSTVTDDLVSSGAIDSPLQNLAIYRQLMLTGYLGADSAPINLPDSASPQNVLNTAARSLGAAMDKTGKVSVDTVVYLNRILGLTDEAVKTYLPKACIEVKEEVQGVVQMVRKCFLNFDAFGYNRTANFSSLPLPAYIPADSPTDGWFEYLGVLSETPTFAISQGPILSGVPQLAADSSLTASNIGGFAQAADDSRAVIDFMHSWPLPTDYATPLSCAASGESHSDVSISDQSGLQVPVRMVAGTEGREFTLTVANAGPDATTGTIVLSATDSDGEAIPTFPRSYSFELAPGSSQAWTEGFSVDYVTTITWAATANAENDVNPANNTVTATTEVIGKGRGQGGGQ